MAVDKLVDSALLDTDLTAVADAIRTKGGTSASLTFPNGFVDAIDAIETGGGGGINILDVNEPSGAFVSDYPGDNGSIKGYALAGRVAVTSVHLTAATAANGYSVSYCNALEILVGEKLRAINNYGIYSNPKLAVVDMLGGNGVYDRIYNNGFNRCGALKTLIIRAPYCITLGGGLDGAFNSNGAGGTLYVPSALISSYQAATNWSTILSYENNQILPIEGSIYETQYADGTPIT